MKLNLTKEDRDAINGFLWGTLIKEGPPPINASYIPGITREQNSESYQQWARGGRAWRVMGQGGTGQMAALCWYHHIHKPGSREWRPSIIIRALLAASRPSDAAAAGERGREG